VPERHPGDRDQALPKRRARLGRVDVAYTDLGEGEPILMVHGIPTSSYLWRNVIRELRDGYRCIAPDLMGLGDTDTPLDHRYDTEAQADKLLELCDHLGLERFTLVCHDQGGAAAQWLAVHHPERIARFVCTNCVCYDNWPVPLVAFFMRLLERRAFSSLALRLSTPGRWGKSRWGMRLGVHDPEQLSDAAIDEYMKFGLRPEKYEQFRAFALAGDCRYTLEAARGFGELHCPTLVVWAADDRWLSVSWAKRLVDDIAGARRLEIVPFAGHFLQEEKPREVARAIDRFMQEEARA
jgi:pimeloyl-ACP methyl ester carboxylesterase